MAEMSGQDIYDNFQQGAGPEGLTRLADNLNEVVPRYAARGAQLQRLLANMESYWQGDAAAGATRGADPMLAAHSEAIEKFLLGQDLINRQAGSFSEAKHKVVPVPEAPTEVQPWLPEMSGEYATYRQQLSEHNEAAQHNVDVMNGYTGASTYNTENLPTGFETLAADNSGMSVAEPGTVDTDSFGDSGGGSGPRGSGPVSGPAPGPSDGAPAGPVTPPDTRPPSDSTPGGTPETTTPESTTPGAHSPIPGAGSGGPPPAADSGRPVPTGGLGPGVGFPVGGGGGERGGGTPRGGGGPIGGSPVPRGGAVVGAEPHGQSPRAATPLGNPAAGRGAGPAMGGMPMGTKRDEDTERKTPTYLEAGDPDDLYGTDVLTAPPVIGEDEEDDD